MGFLSNIFSPKKKAPEPEANGRRRAFSKRKSSDERPSREAGKQRTRSTPPGHEGESRKQRSTSRVDGNRVKREAPKETSRTAVDPRRESKENIGAVAIEHVSRKSSRQEPPPAPLSHPSREQRENEQQHSSSRSQAVHEEPFADGKAIASSATPVPVQVEIHQIPKSLMPLTVPSLPVVQPVPQVPIPPVIDILPDAAIAEGLELPAQTLDMAPPVQLQAAAPCESEVVSAIGMVHLGQLGEQAFLYDERVAGTPETIVVNPEDVADWVFCEEKEIGDLQYYRRLEEENEEEDAFGTSQEYPSTYQPTESYPTPIRSSTFSWPNSSTNQAAIRTMNRSLNASAISPIKPQNPLQPPVSSPVQPWNCVPVEPTTFFVEPSYAGAPVSTVYDIVPSLLDPLPVVTKTETPPQASTPIRITTNGEPKSVPANVPLEVDRGNISTIDASNIPSNYISDPVNVNILTELNKHQKAKIEAQQLTIHQQQNLLHQQQREIERLRAALTPTGSSTRSSTHSTSNSVQGSPGNGTVNPTAISPINNSKPVVVGNLGGMNMHFGATVLGKSLLPRGEILREGVSNNLLSTPVAPKAGAFPPNPTSNFLSLASSLNETLLYM